MKTRTDFLSDYKVAKSDCRKFTKCRAKTKKAVIGLKFCVTSVLHCDVYTTLRNINTHNEDLKWLSYDL